jgi:RNA polymerase sigma-70 factor (ECF subfamily)
MGHETTRDSAAASREGVVRSIRFAGDDLALVNALQEGHPGAAAALYDRYAHHVQRVIVRILGFDPELEDLLQEVFVQALNGAASIEDGNRLKAWLTMVTVHTARAHIRRRVKRRWLQFWEPANLPDVPETGADYETRELLGLTYTVLDRMSAKERILLTLRHFDGMALAELADANGISIATVKRQLDRAQKRFAKLARNYPQLAAYIAERGKWRSA